MKLLSVILVDDDRLVLQNMKTLVNWKELGFRIDACALNGKQALVYMRKYMPNLLITDIRMPGIDGLALIKEVHEKYPMTYILIISSYSEFDYVKSALTNGATDYILKSEMDSALFSGKLEHIHQLYHKRSALNQSMLT